MGLGKRAKTTEELQNQLLREDLKERKRQKNAERNEKLINGAKTVLKGSVNLIKPKGEITHKQQFDRHFAVPNVMKIQNQKANVNNPKQNNQMFNYPNSMRNQDPFPMETARRKRNNMRFRNY